MSKMKKCLIAASLLCAGLVSTGSASAGVIRLFGSNSNAAITTFLTSKGHTVSTLTSLTAANLTGVDAVILLRTTGNAALTSFVNNGGMLITEYTAATYGMGLFGGTVTSSGYVGSSAITFTAAGTTGGLAAGVGTNYSAAGATEYFNQIGAIGSATQLATYGNNKTAIAGGKVGAGYVYVNAYDWADGFPSAGGATATLILNELKNRGTIPEPTSIALFSLAFAGLAAARRRTAKQ
eukprot:TRINITY_DN20604_c0_g1_i1.p2 TRINITY_DN20604_c0_g1~~TRINITY_DN20604_c0_g1_i1.p2  ORF type:complete len:237 (+),score=21.44 TRINITY_DN20604_c0_g1_i1:29-739(+)